MSETSITQQELIPDSPWHCFDGDERLQSRQRNQVRAKVFPPRKKREYNPEELKPVLHWFIDTQNKLGHPVTAPKLILEVAEKTDTVYSFGQCSYCYMNSNFTMSLVRNGTFWPIRQQLCHFVVLTSNTNSPIDVQHDEGRHGFLTTKLATIKAEKDLVHAL
ncbi:hypothetical protein PC123_g843 [Phytophthora cactorum]|nr:hypothetical protein PC123_g843 [Phytophthora cactorum]